MRYVMGFLCLIGSLALLYTGLRSSKPDMPTASEPNSPFADPNQIYLKQVVPPVITDETSSLVIGFLLKNDGDADLTFTGVRKSCSCAEADLDRMSLKPGEETTLRVGLRLPGRFGLQRTVCSVDEASGKVWVCELETMVYQRTRFTESATHFGLTDPGSTHTKAMSFVCAARSEGELPTGFRFATKSSRVQLGEPAERVEKQPDGVWLKTVSVPATVTAATVPGAGAAEVAVSYSVSGNPGSSKVSLDWYVPSVFVMSPAHAFVTAAEKQGGESVERSVSLRRRDGKAFALKSITCPHACVTVHEESVTPELVAFVLTVDPRKQDGFLMGNVVLKTDDAAQPELLLPVAFAPN